MSDKDHKYIVFIDLDDTLLMVNSGKVLVGEAFRQGLMRKRDLLTGVFLSLLYKINLAHTTRIVEKMALWLKGLEETKIVELTRKICDETLFDQISKEIISEIQIHRKKNASIVLLSAATTYICHPIAAHLKMDDVICSSLEVRDGIFSGYPDGQLVFGKEKGLRLTEYCEKENFPLETAYCYADSFSDLSMMEITGHPVAVRPDRRLGKAARKRGWRIING